MELIKTNGQPLIKKPTIKLTNGLLLNYHQQFEQMRMSSSVHYYSNFEKITEFYAKYEKIIFDVNIKISDLRKKYFEHDENGKPVFDEAIPQQKKPKLKEGMTREGYTIESNALMGEVVFVK